MIKRIVTTCSFVFLQSCKSEQRNGIWKQAEPWESKAPSELECVVWNKCQDPASQCRHGATQAGRWETQSLNSPGSLHSPPAHGRCCQLLSQTMSTCYQVDKTHQSWEKAQGKAPRLCQRKAAWWQCIGAAQPFPLSTTGLFSLEEQPLMVTWLPPSQCHAHQQTATPEKQYFPSNTSKYLIAGCVLHRKPLLSLRRLEWKNKHQPTY